MNRTLTLSASGSVIIGAVSGKRLYGIKLAGEGWTHPEGRLEAIMSDQFLQPRTSVSSPVLFGPCVTTRPIGKPNCSLYQYLFRT